MIVNQNYTSLNSMKCNASIEFVFVFHPLACKDPKYNVNPYAPMCFGQYGNTGCGVFKQGVQN